MKFNKKKVAILSLAGVLALGGVAAASAFIIKDATAGTGSFSSEDAIQLKWNSTDGYTKTTVSIPPLTPTNPYVGKVQAVTEYSASAATKEVFIRFALTETTVNGEYLKVEVRDTAFDAGADVKPTYNQTIVNGQQCETTATALNAAQTTYYFRISVSQNPLAAEENVTPEGKLTISLNTK